MKIPTGIVLIGGQSSRMGTDKSRLKIDNIYFYQAAVQKLKPYCDQIYLSINENQATIYEYEFPIIMDKYPNQGPIGGILSCFEEGHRDIIILATDLVNIQATDIETIILIHQRDKLGCTMFYNEHAENYEPLLSVWNSDMLTKLKGYFEKNGRSLQKFLFLQSVATHPLENRYNFKNINSPLDL
jgi:molybdopterin-guanine dinucleotide biosynthesis protein A